MNLLLMVLYDSSRESKFGYTAEESGLIDPHPKPGSLEETIDAILIMRTWKRLLHDVVLLTRAL